MTGLPKSRWTSGDWASVVLPFILVASLAANVLQFRRTNRSASVVAPAVGQVMSPLRVRDTSGAWALIDYRGDRTVVYFFSPSCIWCKVNRPIIKELAEQKKHEFQFLAVSATPKGLGEWLKSDYHWPAVYSFDSPSSGIEYGMTTTPLTLVLARGGRVLGSWKGPYVGAQRKSIERFFSVRLVAEPSPQDGQ
jgi:hypothetical protein